jgi:chemotaxis protein CheD
MKPVAGIARASKSGAEDFASPRRFRHPSDGTWHVQITQGETFVTTAPDEVLTTVLGSCVAACIRDAVAGVGGMNHFLLPGNDGNEKDALCYGVNAMELLINGLMQNGALRNRMEVKLFGGANVMAGFTEIGSRNGEFATHFLREEGIRLVGGDLGGTQPRRIEYWPITGRARQMTVGDNKEEILRRELALAPRKKPDVATESDDVEMF